MTDIEQLEDRQHVSKAFQFSAVNQIVNRILTFLSGIAIMRILSPEDVGIYAAAMAIVVFCTSFNDIAMTPAVIQWEGRVSRAARCGTTIAMTGSGILFAMVFAGADSISGLLNEPELAGPLRLMSFAILIDGLGTIPLALLTRSMHQKRILIIETISLLIQIVTTIGLALNDFGATALIWGMLLSNGFTAIVMFISVPEACIPGFHKETITKLVRFGSPIALSNLFHTGTVNADNIVISAFEGSKELGYYQLGYNGGNLPENTVGATVGRVSFAWFSKIRDNAAHSRKAFHDLTLGLVATTFPFVIFLSVMADDVVHVLYGEKWLPAVDIVRILAFLGGARVFLNFFADIFSANGKPLLELKFYAIWFFTLVPALIAGAYFGGITGVAFAHVAVAALVISPIVGRALSKHGYPVAETARHSLIFVAGAIAQAITSLALADYIESPLASLIIAGGAGALIFLLVTFPSLNAIRKSFTKPDHGFKDVDLVD
jgi:O-antigen/teichoic acid export membrane protein